MYSVSGSPINCSGYQPSRRYFSPSIQLSSIAFTNLYNTSVNACIDALFPRHTSRLRRLFAPPTPALVTRRRQRSTNHQPSRSSRSVSPSPHPHRQPIWRCLLVSSLFNLSTNLRVAIPSLSAAYLLAWCPGRPLDALSRCGQGPFPTPLSALNPFPFWSLCESTFAPFNSRQRSLRLVRSA